MADFRKAYDITKEWEGGWVNHESDLGKETYAAISRRYHPHWHGWAIVDATPNKTAGMRIDDATLRTHVFRFYLDEFWTKMRGNDIASQALAGFIFDWFVNSGTAALLQVQKVLLMPVRDGKFGVNTIAALNSRNEAILMPKLIAARLQFVQDIVTRNPSQRVFLKGWQNRIKSFQ